MPIGIGIASASAGLIGSGLQAGAANKASKAAQAASQANLDFSKGIYNTATGNLQPTITQGQNAGGALAGLLGIGGNPAAADSAFKHYLDSTNYNFIKDQGLSGVRYANATSFKSGATGKALINYGEGMAGNALSGYEAMLGGQQQLGAQSALGLGSLGTNISQIVSNANNYGAAGIGNGAIAGANAWGNGLAGINSAFNQAVTQSSFGNPSAFPGASALSSGMSGLNALNNTNFGLSPSTWAHF